MASSCQITIKIELEGDLRRVKIQSTAGYEDLNRTIQEAWPRCSAYLATYTDDEGDVCSLCPATFPDFLALALDLLEGEEGGPPKGIPEEGKKRKTMKLNLRPPEIGVKENPALPTRPKEEKTLMMTSKPVEPDVVVTRPDDDVVTELKELKAHVLSLETELSVQRAKVAELENAGAAAAAAGATAAAAGKAALDKMSEKIRIMAAGEEKDREEPGSPKEKAGVVQVTEELAAQIAALAQDLTFQQHRFAELEKAGAAAAATAAFTGAAAAAAGKAALDEMNGKIHAIEAASAAAAAAGKAALDELNLNIQTVWKDEGEQLASVRAEAAAKIAELESRVAALEARRPESEARRPGVHIGGPNGVSFVPGGLSFGGPAGINIGNTGWR